MNFAALFFSIFAVATGFQATAAETLLEKASVKAHDASRAMKKAAHRVEEKTCTEGKLKCAAKKVGHRVVEAKDATVDKAKEMKNKIDD